MKLDFIFFKTAGLISTSVPQFKSSSFCQLTSLQWVTSFFSEFSLTQFVYMLNVIFNVWSSISALHKDIKLKLYILYAYIIKWVLLELQCCLYLDAAVDADDHIVKLSAGIGQQRRQQQWHPCCFANSQILVKCRQLGCGIVASFQFGPMN